jgi:Ca2+-binding RTX toxin-like protein
VINTQNGDDQIDASAMNIPVEIYAGAGADKLTGGTSADILVGGSGDDKLIGGPGRDLLIGGRDADKILGDTDEDVLVGGYSAHDGNAVALRLISDEWRSTRSYNTRVNNIRGTVLTNDRANGTTHMTANVTTWDDDAVDTLSGDAGRDWFFFNADTQTSKDKVVDADTLLEIMDEVDMEA